MKNWITRYSRVSSLWVGFLTLWFTSLIIKSIIFFENQNSIAHPVSLFVLGSSFDFALAGLVTVSSAFLYFQSEKFSKTSWRLICLFLWLPILFIFCDFIFYEYSGTHISNEHWEYIDPKTLYFIRGSIKDQLWNARFLVLAVPVLGTIIQKRLYFYDQSKTDSRGRLILILNTLLILGISIYVNHSANSEQAGLIMHRSGLGRNPLIYNFGLALEKSRTAVIIPQPIAIAQLQRRLNLGTKWEFESSNFPWKRKFKSSVNVKRNNKNLIFIFLESFSASSVTPLSPLFHDTTPEFNQLSREGSLFTRTFMNGIPTAPALASTLCSLHDSKGIVRNKADLNLKCGAEILKENGFKTAIMTDADIEFDNLKNFFGQNGFKELIGDRQFQARSTEHAPSGQFGEHNDRELFQEASHWIDHNSSDHIPFFLTLVTTTNHDPFPQYGDPFQSKEGSGKLQRAHSTMKFVDHALGEFVRSLKTKAIYKDTIIFILADHPSWFVEKTPETQTLDNVIVHSWIPLLILNPVGLSTGKSYNLITSQVDLMPTALDMLGIFDRQSLAGHSLIDETVPNDQRFALILAGHFERVVWVENNRALSLHERSGTTEFFDLAEFPRKTVKITQPSLSESQHQSEMLGALKNYLEINRWAIESNHIWSPVN